MKVGEYKYETDGVVHCHQYHIVCPGCKTIHAIGVGQHKFNGNMDKPTFSPSLLATWVYMPEGPHDWKSVPLGTRHPLARDMVCHSFVTDGFIRFLDDCTHDLKNQTVELPEFEVERPFERDRYINLPMKPLENLLIPAVNRADLTERCVRSIDYPIKNLVLLNNGGDPDIEKLFCAVMRREIPVPAENIFYQHRHLYGIGCSGAFNFFVKMMPEAPYWFWTSNDMQFEPGSLKQFAEVMHAEIPNNIGIVYCGVWGFACAAVRRVAIDRVGFMDENIYPAYCEDCDYGYRMLLGGLTSQRVECGMVHGEPGRTSSCTINTEDTGWKNGITHPNNMGYYIQKWGGRVGEEKFKTPFERDLPLDYWKLDLDARIGNIWELMKKPQ